MRGSQARSWAGRSTRAGSRWRRRSHASPRDARVRRATRRRARRARAPRVESDRRARGGGRRVPPRPARCLPQHGGPRRSLAGGPRHGAGARAGRRHLAIRRARRGVRHAAADRRCEPTGAGARRGRRARWAGHGGVGRRHRRSRRHPARSRAPGAHRRPSADTVLRCLRRLLEGPRRVSAGDTIRLRVSFGTAGKRETGSGKRNATLAVNLGGRRIASRAVPLPDSGIVSSELTFPVSRFPRRGWVAVEVRLEGVGDEEPRDDARLFVLEVSPQPSVVLLASPPDWETRFLARALEDVARVPVRTFIEAEPGRGRWRDGATLEGRAPDDVARAVAGAALVIEAGDPAMVGRFSPKGAVLLWPSQRRFDGDWYAQPPPSGLSPLAAALAGVGWDSVPPATSLAELAPDSSTSVALVARLARRGPPRPMVTLSEHAGARRAAIAAGGLYRWAVRGGAG